MKLELYEIVLLASIFFLNGCATPQPSSFVQSLLKEDTEKARVIIYRSTEESLWFKNNPTEIFIDKNPFLKLHGGEYLPIFLDEGEHLIEASYDQPSTLDFKERERLTINLVSAETFYLKIAPHWEGMGVFMAIFFVPVPVPATAIELSITDEHTARMVMGKALELKTVRYRLIE